MSAIRIKGLNKEFVIRQTQPGLSGAVKGLFFPIRHRVKAIQELSLTVEAGERVAFIGPNGAGKSTTIKMLTGILYPTSGSIEVLGLIPWKHRQKLGYHIGTVFGQRTQLWYHLPPSDTFALLAKIYELPPNVYAKRVKELTQLFGLKTFLHKPVRQLSLGERMRCELVASLLHDPKILFLDEPTIGLDINAKLMIRDLLNKLSQEQGTTLFLTSHDTADIEQVCERVLILEKGKLVLDSSIRELKKKTLRKKVLTLITDEKNFSLHLEGVTILQAAQHHFVCEVDVGITSMDRVIQEALRKTNVKDITIEDPSLEEIIREIYGSKNTP